MERTCFSGHFVGSNSVPASGTIPDTLFANFVDLPRSGNRSRALSLSRVRQTDVYMRQILTQLVGGAEESVLGRLFAGVQHVANGAQLESIVVSELKNQSLTSCESLQRDADMPGQFLSQDLALRVTVAMRVRDMVEHIRCVSVGSDSD